MVSIKFVNNFFFNAHEFLIIDKFYACGYFGSSSINTYGTNSFAARLDVNGAVLNLKFVKANVNTAGGDGLHCQYDDNYLRGVMISGSGYGYLVKFSVPNLDYVSIYQITDSDRYQRFHSLHVNNQVGNAMVALFESTPATDYQDVSLTCHISESDNYNRLHFNCTSCSAYKMHLYAKFIFSFEPK